MPKKGQFSKKASKRSRYQRIYNSKPAQKKRRAARNKARRKAIRSGRVKKGSSMDVHHRDRRGLSPGSTTVRSRKANRSNNSHLSKRRRKK